MKKISIIFCMFLIFGIIAGVFFYHSNEKNKPIYLSNIDDISTIAIENGKFSDDINVIGLLSIDSIGLKEAPIAEGTTMDILDRYIGHFEETPYLNGNVSLCGHNRGYTMNYFENLKNVNIGDLVEYKTKNKLETYKIIEINQILETNIEVLKDNGKEQLTLITCVENKPQYRYCVLAEKI